MLEHGGRIRRAAAEFGIPEDDWLDLSTGINPHGYPVGALPAEVWRCLPDDDDGLEASAAASYGAAAVLATAGSQPAIQLLPRLVPPGPVAVLAPSYAEHAENWRRAGHAVAGFAAAELEAAAAGAAVVVLCSPNNPDATVFDRERLLRTAAVLADRGGLLVVDEAFADACPQHALVAFAGTAAAPNLIVLRSLGKFFGLAGARVGFVACAPQWRAALREAGGPWPVAGPARVVAQRALADLEWQAATRTALAAASARLAGLLGELGKVRASALFVWLALPESRVDVLFRGFALRGILVRRFSEGLRVGLPGAEEDWGRLQAAVEVLRRGG